MQLLNQILCKFLITPDGKKGFLLQFSLNERYKSYLFAWIIYIFIYLSM